MITTQDITRGTDWGATVVVKDAAGAAVNLTGATVGFIVQVQATSYAGTAAISNAAGGTISLSLTDTLTATFPVYAEGTGQVFATFSSGTVSEILRFPLRTLDRLEVTP